MNARRKEYEEMMKNKAILALQAYARELKARKFVQHARQMVLRLQTAFRRERACCVAAQRRQEVNAIQLAFRRLLEMRGQMNAREKKADSVRQIQSFLICRKWRLRRNECVEAVKNMQRFYRRAITFEKLNTCVLRMEDAVISI